MKNALFIFFIAISFFQCKKEEPTIETEDYSEVLEILTNEVILYTYMELSQSAIHLQNAVASLTALPDDLHLSTARNAWIAARQPWEQSEGFLFGPVDTEGLDPALDSWPVNQVDLENVLASTDPLTIDYVQALEGTLKGFHTIEFLLWGGNGEKTIAQFTDREFEYLTATTQVLVNDAQRLSSAWKNAEGDFGSHLIRAGQTGSIYISQKAALEELALGILIIADEVGNGKINDPLEQEDFSLEESRFSNNSKTDFANNIKSIQNIYLGINGQGLSKIISHQNTLVDQKILEEIQGAIDAIEAIPGTFTDAIPSSSPTRGDAENAQRKVRTLQQTLEEKLIPIISNL